MTLSHRNRRAFGFLLAMLALDVVAHAVAERLAKGTVVVDAMGCVLGLATVILAWKFFVIGSGKPEEGGGHDARLP